MNVYNELKEVLTYYKEFFFESREEDIKRLEHIIKNNDNNYGEYLKDLEEAKKMNERLEIINFLCEQYYKEKNEENMIRIVHRWSDLEKQIKDKKIKKIPKALKLLLLKYFNDENNIEDYLNIFNKDQIEYFMENNKNLMKTLQNLNQ